MDPETGGDLVGARRAEEVETPKGSRLSDGGVCGDAWAAGASSLASCECVGHGLVARLVPLGPLRLSRRSASSAASSGSEGDRPVSGRHSVAIQWAERLGAVSGSVPGRLVVGSAGCGWEGPVVLR